MTTATDSKTLSTYWHQQIGAWKQTGLSQTQFCRTHHLSYHRFVYWRRKLESTSQHTIAAAKGSGFTTVACLPATDEALSLALPNGCTLSGITHNNLAVVSQLLEQLS